MAIRFSGSEGRAIETEFVEVDLGDERLDARLVSVAKLMAEKPGASFSAMCSDEAEREGLYRLLRNPRVESEDIISPHLEATVRRSVASERVLVVHDTTDIRISNEAELESYLNRGMRGFRAHMSLAVRSRDAAPLGICGLETVLRKSKKSRTKKNGKRMNGNDTAALKQKEYDRWLRGVRGTENRLAGVETVHVMDREADSYALIASMVVSDIAFVVRLAHKSRRAKTSKDDAFASIEAVLADAKTFRRTREIHVSKRKAKRVPSAAKRYGARSARSAELTLSFARVIIPRPIYLGSELPDEITLHVVRARESDPPEGATPIEWTLLTSMTIETKAAVEDVIDIYRKRWLIEEYFRALKTGCAIRKRKLINASSILNSLATFIPIAWRALWLRQRARSNDQSPATTAFTDHEIAIIRATFDRPKRKRKLPAQLTVADVFALIAEAGGHRKRDGEPGWQTLLCGLDKFVPQARGAQLADVMEM